VVGKGWEELAVVCKYKGRCESGVAQLKTGVMRRGYMRGGEPRLRERRQAVTAAHSHA
jgi:hypothetical protein